jgi:3-hydroxyacyl-[acyl-carrier-protein] dehydratase
MSSQPATPATTAAPSAPEVSAPPNGERARPGAKLLFDLSALDLSSRDIGWEQIEKRNPHRGLMRLIDYIVWTNADLSQGVALRHISDNEFWVPGHFPGRPIMPGVLQLEAAAQLACYLFITRKDVFSRAAFLRIEEVAFRSMVVPGDDLHLLCQDVKYGRRNFTCDVQGVVQARNTFDGRISGMMIQ